MTAVLVGVLVALAVLTWSSGGAVARRASLRPRGGPVARSARPAPGLAAGATGGPAAVRAEDPAAGLPAGLTAGPAAGPARAAPTAPWSGWFVARRRRRWTEQAELEALDLLDGLVPALRAGLPPVAALRLVTASRPRASPGDPGWGGLDAAAARGDPLAPAWSAYAAAIDSDDLRLVAAAWSLCETLGSPLAPTVATVAAVVRSRRVVRHRIAAALAGPQATMRVLTALPLSGPIVAVAVGVPPSELYAGAAGLTSLVVGLTLLLVGRAWASRMVRAVTLEPHPRARTLRGDERRGRRHLEPHPRAARRPARRAVESSDVRR